MAYKYFIEDMDTHQFYTNPMLLRFPQVHTFGQGWDCEEPSSESRWTIDPEMALQFEDKAIVEKILSDGQWTNGMPLYGAKNLEFYDWKNRKLKNLQVTEHEFVAVEPSGFKNKNLDSAK